MATYYCAPTTASPAGNDSNSGTIGSPWATLNHAWGSLSAGDTLYLRGGTHEYDHMQYLQSHNGTAGNLINIWGYPGETPILTRSPSYVVTPGVDQDLIYVEGNYLHWQDIEIAFFDQKPGETPWSAFRFGDSSNCIFKRISYHDNMASMSIRGASSNNLIEDCDFYRNSDPYGSDGAGLDAWDGADGLQINFCTGTGNIIRNCRAWWNCDDGFDLWENTGVATIENCWAFWNGYRPGTFTAAGNGSGIKLGQTTGTTITTKYRTVQNCIVHKNRSFGIVENALLGQSDIFNNTVSESGVYSFWFGAWNASVSNITNNVSYNDAGRDIGGSAIETTNSWQGGLTVNSSDFQSLDDSQLNAARNSDGTLPSITFMKLTSGSDLINAGTDVGLPYTGPAPDLGYAEYSASGTNTASLAWLF